MNAFDAEWEKVEMAKERQRIAYAQTFESPSQMIAKIDAMILDIERQKAISSELIAKCYELRGAFGRREK